MGQKNSLVRTYEEYMISVRKNVCPYDEYQQCFINKTLYWINEEQCREALRKESKSQKNDLV